MKIVITGGGGFLGTMLCRKLLEKGRLTAGNNGSAAIDEIVLVDRVFTPSVDWSSESQVVCRAIDISDAEAVFELVGDDGDVSIFHLASMVSGECELNFDDALRVNLDGGRNVLEAARRASGTPRLVFASSIACFGGDSIPETFSDASKHLPQTTYGATKAIIELLVNDYSRKGFIDGRSARLPTVIVRPGKPNAAASSWASGMFREPLAGEDCLLPIRRDQQHPMTGYGTVVESLIALHELDSAALGVDRAVGLPAHTVTPQLAESVIREVAEERKLILGRIVDAYDERIQGIVDGWAKGIEAARAEQLGLPRPPAVKQIVCEYLDDFGG